MDRATDEVVVERSLSISAVIEMEEREFINGRGER